MRRLIPIYLLLVAAYAANFIDRFFGGKETSQQMAPPQVPAPPIAKSPPPKPEWQKPKLCDDEQYKDVPELPCARKLIGFADIHGDCKALNRVLERAGVFYEQKWHADNTFVVQTGNLVDIGEHDQDVLEKMYKVQTAKARYFFPMMGAHEGKLTAGDFSSSKQLRLSKELVTLCDGNYNRMIRSWPMVRKVGDVLFAHGGMSLYWAEEFQKKCRQGEGKTGPTGYALVKCINMLQAEYMAELCSKGIQPDDRRYTYMQSYLKGNKDINTEKMGPLWYKGYGSFEPNPNRAASIGEDEICKSVKKMLKLFDCQVHVIAARSWLTERQSDMSKTISFCGGALLKTDFEMSNLKRVHRSQLPRRKEQKEYEYEVPQEGTLLSWYEFIDREPTVTFYVEKYPERTRTKISIDLPGEISLYTADEDSVEGGASVWNQDEGNRDSVCQGASQRA